MSSNFSVIPYHSYSVKLIGIGFFFIGLVVYILDANSLIRLDAVGNGFPKWIIVLGMTLFNFSKERKETTQTAMARLFTFKALGVFIVCFILAINLVSLIFNIDLDLPSLLIAFIFNLFFGAIYFLTLIFPRLISNEDEESFSKLDDTGTPPKSVYYVWAILSVLTLFIIAWM